FYNTITANRRRIAPVPLILKDNRWRCDMDRLEAALAEPKNTLLLLCSPHNPTGKVWRREELETMAALCQKHGVRVISDEIHMDMTWG
ncbi:aminotransferase class I/II-fold pyridoxal phosphate-dependent enzyme, partial [Citrobacter freundii]